MTWSRVPKVYQWQGRDYTLTQLSRLADLPNHVIRARLARGCTLEESIMKPTGSGNWTARGEVYELDGQSRRLSEWALVLAISENTLRSRLRLGWTFERAALERAHRLKAV